MADITNASKSPKPIKTDLELLSIFRKRSAASRAAAEEFAAANRQDLREKETAQVAILDEYASKVEVVGEEEMSGAIENTAMWLKGADKAVDLPSILKLLVGPEGSLAAKPVDRGSLVYLVKTFLKTG